MQFCRLHYYSNLLEWIILSGLSLFGLVAVTSMVVAYAFEHRSHWFILGFAFACALGSVYGFLQGAWPFGLVEAVWSVIALRRWAAARKTGAGTKEASGRTPS